MIDYIDEAGNQASEGNRDNKMVRKIICRYGRGCTHMHDPIHIERFWHPFIPQLTDEIIMTHHLCNECGAAFKELDDLLLHLKRKTAWSNASLVGCRISCLVDYKEWHEGYVTQFHKSGKHFVEFRLVGEKRWLNMKKVAFYIVERPQVLLDNCEFKDDDNGEIDSSLAPIEDNWIYVEDLTKEYALVQSLLFKIYGANVQETGHKTRGHTCVTETDKERARVGKGSLLYGELLPRGANKAFNYKRLAAEFATCLFDLGMGTGKIAIQAFLQFRNLKYVYGIELSAGRYALAEEAALRMVEILGEENFQIICQKGKRIVVTEMLPLDKSNDNSSGASVKSSTKSNSNEYLDSSKLFSYHDNARILHLECGDMFTVPNIEIADIVMLETDIPADLHPQLCKLLDRMHERSRTLTYLDIRKLWTLSTSFPFKQLECNKFLSDRFPTSWSVQRGHHFFLWFKNVASSSSNINLSNGYASQLSYFNEEGRIDLQSLSNSSKLLSLSNNYNNSLDSTHKEKKKRSDHSKNGNCLPFSIDLPNILTRLMKRKDQNEKEPSSERSVIPIKPVDISSVQTSPNLEVIIPGKGSDDLNNPLEISNFGTIKRVYSPSTIVSPGGIVPNSNTTVDINNNVSSTYTEVVTTFLEKPYSKHNVINKSPSRRGSNDSNNDLNSYRNTFQNEHHENSLERADSIIDDSDSESVSDAINVSVLSNNLSQRQLTSSSKPIVSNHTIQSHIISMKSNNNSPTKFNQSKSSQKNIPCEDSQSNSKTSPTLDNKNGCAIT